MAINTDRAYQRIKSLYAARTGTQIQDDIHVILPDIVQAILEELYLHTQVQTQNFAQYTNQTQSGTGNPALKFLPGQTLEQT